MSSSSAATASTPTPPIPTATPLTYSASGLPDGISINPSTGVISGTLSFASAGVHTVLVTVSDGHRHRHRQLHLDGDRHQPGAGLQHRPAVDRTDAEGGSSSAATASTPTPPIPTATPLTYSASGLPDGISINPSTGAISGTLSSASAGVHTVLVTVSDDTDTDTDSFTWTVTGTNRAPVFSTDLQSPHRRRG